MSLIGNLEDLSLPDILQIISLSKKSGVLIVQRGDEEGKIYFRQGKVTLAIGPRNRRNIGNLLIEKGLITPDQLAAAVDEQRRGDMKQLLGAVLVQMELIPQESLEKVVQEQIEESVYYFLTWRDGTFKFDLKEVDGRMEVGIDPQVFITHKGIDTQWLVLEGTRLMDEKKTRGHARGGYEPQGETPGLTEQERTYLLVDDDEHFSDIFVSQAARSGRQVRRLSSAAEATEFLASSLGVAGFFMIIDVVMPTIDGRGFLGGLELARTIAASYPEIAVRIITAYPDDSVREELLELDLPPYILKPPLSDAEQPGPGMERFVEEVFRFARPASPTEPPLTPAQPAAAPTPPAPSGKVDIAESLTIATKTLESALNHHPRIKLMVTDLMGELNLARTQSEVVLIILRLASELLERAMLMKTTGRTAVSLGGFGFESSTIRNRDGLRNVSIDVDHSPAIATILATLRPMGSPEDALAPDDIVSVIVGDPPPASWLIQPAPMSDEATLVLYGDSGHRSATIEGGDALGLFLNLAGLVIRRIHKDRPGATPAGGRVAR